MVTGVRRKRDCRLHRQQEPHRRGLRYDCFLRRRWPLPKATRNDSSPYVFRAGGNVSGAKKTRRPHVSRSACSVQILLVILNARGKRTAIGRCTTKRDFFACVFCQPSTCKNANLRFTAKGKLLVNDYSGLCLEAAASGVPTQAACDAKSDAQSWVITPNSTIKNGGKCLTQVAPAE